MLANITEGLDTPPANEEKIKLRDLPAEDRGSLMTPFGRLSRGKMIMFGIGIALIFLALFIGIYSAMTSGFDSFAKRASKVISPFDPAPAPEESPAPTQTVKIAPPPASKQAAPTAPTAKPEGATPTAPGL